MEGSAMKVLPYQCGIKLYMVREMNSAVIGKGQCSPPN